MTQHPMLPCGFNCWEINGDEANGSGVNEPIWPVYFDTFIAYQPLIVTDEMQDVFEGGRPDLVFSCVPNEIVYPCVANEIVARNGWPMISFQAVSDTLVFPAAEREFVASQTWKDTNALPLGDNKLTLPEGTRTQPVKELT